MTATRFERLRIYAAEAFAPSLFEASDSLKMTVDLFDVRAWRFFQASPQSFFEQYADDFVIVNAHAVEGFLEKAAEFLQDNLLSRLTVCGRFSRQNILAFAQKHQDDDIGLGLHFLNSPRVLEVASSNNTVESFGLKGHFRDLTHLIACAGMKNTDTSPAAYWTETFKHLLIEDIVPELGIRDRSVFFAFIKALAGFTAQGLNWAALGSQAGISAPCARDWTQFLAQIGVIDLIEPLSAPPPRRAKIRKKLYWTTPGLALWLSDNMTSPDKRHRDALLENIVYLALKDALPQAQFLHFLDTNYIKAQLIASTEGVNRAYYFESETFTRQEAVKSLKSLSKINLVDTNAFLVHIGETLEEVAKIETLLI